METLGEIGVRRATAEDLTTVARTLARAFERDPAWAHVLPDEVHRPKGLLAFFGYEIAHLPRGHELWTTEDGSGAAVWAKPGHWRAPLPAALRSAPAMCRVFGRGLPLAARSQWRAERLHPDEEAHWYLHFLGVVPERQGRGIGGRLMEPILRRCDQESIPAFLEASTDRNRALYERHGFAVSGRLPMPRSGPMLCQMWREPLPSRLRTGV
jgi:GNAT superfamily N-acetyltransferase